MKSLIFKQGLPATIMRNIWRPVRRIYLLTLGLKELMICFRLCAKYLEVLHERFYDVTTCAQTEKRYIVSRVPFGESS